RSSILTLIRADQRKRWQRGERLLAEAYLVALPAVASQEETALDVIFSEIALREELGEKPGQDEYLRRFPRYETALRRQFVLNQARDDCSLLQDESDGATLPPGASGERSLPLSESRTMAERPAATADSTDTATGDSVENATFASSNRPTRAAISINVPD